ncbi:Phage protein [Streptococcus oralis]|uniref:Phage protein n=2 Tax=Streptococcus oralis TaxID=1303 RepID=A0A139P1F2_STROR|nr:Phage protein [Streptococcus oralis]
MYQSREVMVSDGSIWIDDEDSDANIWIENNDLILMQSTGLKDKNGKEIFEGDVVRVLDSTYTVFYDSEKGSYRLKPHDDRWNVDYMSNFPHGENFEVVGNIYENPELVEVTE